MKIYYQTHKDELKAYHRTYRESHKEEKNAYDKNHKEKLTVYHKAYYDAHKEEIKAYTKIYDKDYRESHKEEIKVRAKAWNESHKEEVKASNKAWHKANKEERKVKDKAWAKANPDRVRARVARRRAKKAGVVTLQIRPNFLAHLIEEWDNKCAYCKNTSNVWHKDHFMPLALKGHEAEYNYVLACPPCNLSKGPKHPFTFIKEQKICFTFKPYMKFPY